MIIKVRCSNPACGQTSPLGDDGLKRVFRCPGCRSILPTISSRPRVRDLEATGRASAASTARPDADPTPRALPISTREDEVGQATEPSELGPSSRLGRLQLRDKLGSGSFATIYLAFDPLLERDVTLKVFHTAAEECSKDIDHFATEAKALARLRHPQIVPIFDAGREGEYHYITMQFIEGRTLADARSDGPLDPRHAARIIAEVAEALAYAHGLGIVHRDVKPSNILLDDRGAAYLIDFGLAHRREKVVGMDRPGAIRGTPAYLAPEQARGDDAVPQPSNDQYGLGVILYELLCGQPPFSGPPLLVLISALQYEPPRPTALNPGVPRGLEAICLKALSKRPEDRYPSCQMFAEDLQRWLRGEPVMAEPPGTRTRAVRWFRQIRQLAATILTLLMLLLPTLLVCPRPFPV